MKILTEIKNLLASVIARMLLYVLLIILIKIGAVDDGWLKPILDALMA